MQRQKSEVYEEAEKLIWAGRLTQAEAMLKSHIKDDPWAGFAYFQTMVWRVVMLDFPEHDTQAQVRADRLAASVEMLIEAVTGSDSDSRQRQIELVVLVGIINLWKGILHTYKQRYVKAPMALRYTWKMFERATNLAKVAKDADPDFKLNSYTKAMMSFGFGIFHFSAAFAPKEVKSVVEMLGISSDASKALQELSNTVEIGEFAIGESLLGLNVLYQFFVDKLELVPQNFDRLFKIYPESPVLHSIKGSFLRHQGKIDEALASFRESHRLVDELDAELKQFAATTSYQIGYCLYLKGDWLEASKQIQHFLSETKTMTYKAHAGLILGLCLWFETKDKKQDIIQKITGLYEKLNPSSSVFDLWASRRAQAFLSRKGFTKWDEVLLQTLNFVEAHEYERALAFVLPAKDFLLVPPFRSANLWCEYLYLKGVCLRGLGRMDEALFTFKKVVRLEGSINTSIPGLWACAYASLESFEIHMEDHELKENAEEPDGPKTTENYPLARRWVSKALWYSGYTWDPYVAVRANIGQEKLRTKIKEKENEAKERQKAEKLKLALEADQKEVEDKKLREQEKEREEETESETESKDEQEPPVLQPTTSPNLGVYFDENKY